MGSGEWGSDSDYPTRLRVPAIGARPLTNHGISLSKSWIACRDFVVKAVRNFAPHPDSGIMRGSFMTRPACTHVAQYEIALSGGLYMGVVL
jgi:hypothetical protein